MSRIKIVYTCNHTNYWREFYHAPQPGTEIWCYQCKTWVEVTGHWTVKCDNCKWGANLIHIYTECLRRAKRHHEIYRGRHRVYVIDRTTGKRKRVQDDTLVLPLEGWYNESVPTDPPLTSA
jgi:hypothetical protein